MVQNHNKTLINFLERITPIPKMGVANELPLVIVLHNVKNNPHNNVESFLFMISLEHNFQ
jgi:hypothetical protein